MEKLASPEKEWIGFVIHLSLTLIAFEQQISMLTSLVSTVLSVAIGTFICLQENFNENLEIIKTSRNFWTMTLLLFGGLIKFVYKGEPTILTSYLGFCIMMPILMSLIRWIIWLYAVRKSH